MKKWIDFSNNDCQNALFTGQFATKHLYKFGNASYNKEHSDSLFLLFLQQAVILFS